MLYKGLIYGLTAVSSLFTAGSGKPRVLQPTPPMGFNNWARYMGGLNESLFTATADAMVANGLLEAGYNRLNLDDEWSTMERAANGSMLWDTQKFPHGLPWLTKYMKDRGFTPGIYTDAGNLSCAGFPGALGHEEIDAHDFAAWGFEYLKLDGCNMPDTTEETYRKVYGHWHEILSSMPNPMVFSESAPAYFAEATNLTDWYTVMGWVPEFGQLARHSRDSLVWNSTNYWPTITGWDSVMFNYEQEIRLARYQRPGYFNDPDFLNVDHFDYTLDEKRSHFALWCSLSAPLIISADILNITKAELKYLKNEDLIAVDQDPLAQQATLVSQDGTWDVLTKNLANGDRLLTVLNRGNNTASLEVPFDRIGISSTYQKSKFSAKDLWTGEKYGIKGKVTASNVPSHGTAVFRISANTGSIRAVPTGMIFNTYSLSCLTESGSLSWSTCDGSNGQVWRVQDDGTISSLAGTGKCLVDKNGVAQVDSCSTAKAQKWRYFISGNLKNMASSNCLTEAEEGNVSITACGYETNEQVIALPVGVSITY